MNSAKFQRSEEARRQAVAVALEARQRENALLEERAALFAIERQKVESLRASRLERMPAKPR